jgi:peptide/nickel transport system ATP-binding protein
MAALLDVRGLTVDFDTPARAYRALEGVDFSIERGESVGLVGESGSGKSITWLAVLGLLGGRAHVGGVRLLDGIDLAGLGDASMAKIRGRRIAMIFQDASSALNPVHRIGRQIEEGLRLHWGTTGAAARAEAKRLLDRVRIANAAQRLDEYPHQLSGGMNQRVMIAIALAGKPDLLVADEPTTALDATVQAQVLALLAEIRRDSGMAMVLISHDLGVVAEQCDRIAVMYAGRIVEQAPADALFARPAHPYTAGLLAAIPDLEGPRVRLRAIPGTVPEPWNPPPGCRFAPRCDYAEPACSAAVPPLAAVEPMHVAACIRSGELRATLAALPRDTAVATGT